MKDVDDFDDFTPNTTRDHLVRSLLPAAARALYTENEHLAKAFAKSPQQEQPRPKNLAYPVYETMLHYVIFKAWLPIVDVRWEVKYEGDKKKSADLVVYEGGEPAAVFELKWWMQMSGKPFNEVAKDVKKLTTWNHGDNVSKYLLTFWHEKGDPWFSYRQDEDRLRKVVSKNGADCEMIWKASFSLHDQGESVHQFAMAALQVKQCPISQGMMA